MQNNSSILQKKKIFIFILFFLAEIGHSYADGQYLTLAYGQTNTDFFAESNRQYKPASNSLGYGFEFSDSWSVDFNFEKTEGSEDWLSHRVARQSFYESGESESVGYSIGLTWVPKNHGLSFSYSLLDYDESSITYLPFLIETVKSTNDVYLLSYIGRWNSSAFDLSGIEDGESLESLLNESENEWQLSWNIGLQSINASAKILELLNADAPITLDINLEQKSLSAFAALEISYFIVNQTVNYAPYFSFGWDWGLDVSGEEYILLSRGDQSLRLEQSGSRFNNQIRTPDSGQLELGIKFYWGASKTSNDLNSTLDWITDISYSQSIDSEIETSAVRIALTAYF